MLKPNVMFIVIDAARADRFSCYGNKNQTSPRIDQIAKEGVLFENAISAAGWTLPSHTSMFTGMHVSRHGAHNENHKLEEDLPLLPVELKKAGYQTAGFCRNDWVSAATGLDKGFDYFDNVIYEKTRHKWRRMLNYFHIRGKDSWGFEINRQVKKWLKRKDDKKPFFMFVHYDELHLPYNIPKNFNTKFLPAGMTYEEAILVNQDPKSYYAGVTAMSKSDMETSKALYDCALAYQDSLVGDLYDYLQKTGGLDNTIFIITSDHGESLGDHGHFDHYYVLYDCLLKVPLVLRYPGVFEGGRHDESLVQTLDIFPTIRDMVELMNPALDDMQGLPLPPLTKAEDIREYTISERYQDLAGLKETFPKVDLSHLEKFEKDRKIAIRAAKYKLIQSEFFQSEFFDLETDPGETENLIDKQPELVAEFRQKIEDWRKSFKAADIGGASADFDEKMKDRLKSLGYLG
ncbi:sulfatase [bacterium]|nr:sulfatase [bacterium]